jgi:hypothetical protein
MAKIQEHALLKALNELEDLVNKGDALENADTEGGLSTEGTPLSNKAPSGRGETKKSRRRSSASSSSADDASSVSKASSDMAPPFKKKPAASSASSGDDDSESDDSESDDSESDDSEKSFREVAEGDETMAKAIEVSDFIEALVDQLSRGLGQVTKSLNRIEKRLAAHIDSSVAKSMAHQQNYNARLAQAVVAIGNDVQEQADLMKSIANSPTAPRGKALLSKGEVNQPPWGGAQSDANMAAGSGGDHLQELSELSAEQVGDWLFKKSTAHQIDSKIILAWEADRYNIEVLPVQVRKALANDLCK